MLNAVTRDVVVGPHVPRRGTRFSRWLGRFVLWAMGWKVHGAVADYPKMVVIGAPHTSNMDGVLAIAVLTALGMRAATMIKDTAFHGPMGALLRWFGAIPVNRRSPKGIVEQSVDAFARSDSLLLLIAPEGTRHAGEQWKRGFHHIARGAGVPILPGAVDYVRKRVVFGPPLMAGADYEADLRTLTAFLAANSAPRHAERLSRPMCEALGRTWTSGATRRDG